MKWNRYLVAAAFLLGIVIANLCGEELLTTYGIINTYFLKQYAYADLDHERLFYQILWVRLREMAALLILGKIVPPKALLFFSESFLGISFGFFMVAAIANLGISGIAVVLGGIFPQWLCYLASGGLYFRARMGSGRYGRDNASAIVAGYAVSLLLFLIGILSEAYVNPALWQPLLKRL